MKTLVILKCNPQVIGEGTLNRLHERLPDLVADIFTCAENPIRSRDVAIQDMKTQPDEVGVPDLEVCLYISEDAAVVHADNTLRMTQLGNELRPMIRRRNLHVPDERKPVLQLLYGVPDRLTL